MPRSWRLAANSAPAFVPPCRCEQANSQTSRYPERAWQLPNRSSGLLGRSCRDPQLAADSPELMMRPPDPAPSMQHSRIKIPMQYIPRPPTDSEKPAPFGSLIPSQTRTRPRPSFWPRRLNQARGTVFGVRRESPTGSRRPRWREGASASVLIARVSVFLQLKNFSPL